MLLANPVQALVEPEVEAWQELVAALEEAFPLPGAEILPEATAELGHLVSALTAAPLSDLMADLEQRRGLSFKYFTPWHVKDKEQLRRFISTALEKEYTPEKAAGDEAVLKALGLVPLDFEVVKFMEELLTDAVGGVYDPDTDQFFIVDLVRGQGVSDRLQSKATSMLLGDTSAVIIIHELDHALGGQHFPLKATMDKLTQGVTLDQEMAALALVEGDATFVMLDYQAKQPAEAAGANTFIAGSDLLTDVVIKFPLPLPGMGKFSEAPLFFQRRLIFPYYGGAEFVSMVRLYGNGWEGVNEAYKDLPQSTKAIYHPGDFLYLQRPPLIPDFSALPEPFGDWEKVKDETGGEFLLRVVLEQYGVEDYREAAQGWNGDKLRVFRHRKSGALGFYWAIRWEDVFEAQEFHDSLGSHLPFVVEKDEDLIVISLAFKPGELRRLRTSIR